MAAADEKEYSVLTEKEAKKERPPGTKKGESAPEETGEKKAAVLPGGKTAAKGGRKKLKTLKQVFELLLNSPLGEELAALAGQDGARFCRDMTVYEAIAAVQVAKAIKGDAKAFEFINSTLSEKQTEKGGANRQFPKVMIVRADGSVSEV